MEVSSMPDDERQALEAIYRRLNNTEADYPEQKTLIQLFTEQVARTPDAIAAICGEYFLTYRELDRRSNQVASLLRQNGLGRESIVGIMVERSLEMLIGIYGIVKSGAAYLPIQSDVPIKRFEHIISDSHLRCLLTQGKNRYRHQYMQLTWVDLEDKTIYLLPEDEPKDPPEPSDVMYVIYTSGSTGNPKGVMIEHRAVVNRINWMQKRYPLTASDTILQKTPFVFDVSVWELFWWAVCGATLCLLGPGLEKFPQAIVEEIKRNRITVLHFVPSMFNAFLNALEHSADARQLDTLKYIFSSGEALLPSYVKKLNGIVEKDSRVRLTNLYGPTETTVDVTYYDCPRGEDVANVPIGKPIDNTRLYILDERGLSAQGELCIGGVGLARGYLNNPQLTNEKFVRNPVNPAERLYRTGDVVRLLSDGNIEYIGRIDNQVKIRGIRIELGEIEAKIEEYPSIDQCAVLLHDANHINPLLTAYLLTSNQKMTAQEIKVFLKSHLPDYMIPNRYIITDRFPLTHNGKLDRKALAEQSKERR